MQGHIREHHTNKTHHSNESDGLLSVNEFFKSTLTRPDWAVHLKGFRTREGLTQTELAEKLGVRQSQISEMERGKRAIGKSFAKKLADFFHTDYRSFL